jgi:hypothetical protein
VAIGKPINPGTSAFVNLAGLPTELRNLGHGGGNSGAVISPAPKLGLSAYQDPKIMVLPIPRKDS